LAAKGKNGARSRSFEKRTTKQNAPGGTLFT